MASAALTLARAAFDRVLAATGTVPFEWMCAYTSQRMHAQLCQEVTGEGEMLATDVILGGVPIYPQKELRDGTFVFWPAIDSGYLK